MKKCRVGVIGAAGKMGLELKSLMSDSSVFVPAVAVDTKLTPGFDKCYTSISEVADNQVDVITDFSSPNVTNAVVEWCVTNSVPLVLGTTGLDLSHEEIIRRAADSIPILWSANMSFGVAILREALKVFSKLVDTDFDFQIEEIHHKRKVDQPSGTAKMLQRDLSEYLSRELPAPISIRGGGVFGLHRIYAIGEEEMLVFEHSALSRRVFARGALRGALFICKKQQGLFSVADLIADKI